MQSFPYILCVALFVSLLLLCMKLYRIKRGIKEICKELSKLSTLDTNNLLTVSTHDKWVCKMAAELNRQLRALREERLKYRRGDQSLKESVTNISHDLRTPLTAILGYLHLLSEEENSVNVKHYLAQIENRVGVMKELTEELFRYSVIVTKPEEQTKTMVPIDIGNILVESLTAFYAAFTTHNIVPEIHIPKTRVIRELDKSALARVFENLIGNALKYSDGDFVVTLYEDGRICFSNMASGLDKVLVGKIFDRFFTVETAKESSGLGLSIAKMLTVRMGGRIWAKYLEGRLVVTVMF